MVKCMQFCGWNLLVVLTRHSTWFKVGIYGVSSRNITPSYLARTMMKIPRHKLAHPKPCYCKENYSEQKLAFILEGPQNKKLAYYTLHNCSLVPYKEQFNYHRTRRREFDYQYPFRLVPVWIKLDTLSTISKYCESHTEIIVFKKKLVS